MQVAVLSATGDNVGVVDLPDEVFGIRPSHHAIYEAVRAYLANRRQGTASTRSRSEVAYSGRKPWRQKGTGRARAGTRRSPLWVGGGTVFGPHPRPYRVKLSKKLRALALKSALSVRATEGRITVLEDMVFEEPKTSRMAAALKALKVDEEKCLMVLGDEAYVVRDPGSTGRKSNDLLTEEEYRQLRQNRGTGSFAVDERPHRLAVLSGRNIPRLRTALFKDLCTYDVMWCERVLLTKGAIRALEARLGT
jgi:large subunit ribosomal protein L4